MTETSNHEPIKPIAFMVMPFGEKRPAREEGDRIPDRIDFDQLWFEVFEPVLSEKYDPVRADQDIGPLIIKDMIERLTAADLVVADMTLRNANVYWEIGVRQAARPAGCVLVAADWARPAFDLEQIRQLRYPLPAENPLTEQSCQAARDVLSAGLDQFATGNNSPVFEAVPGFPNPDPTKLASFRQYARKMSEFHKRTKVINQFEADKPEATRALLEANPPEELRSKAIVWEVLRLVRDHLGWDELLSYLDQLPESFKDDPDIQEQRFLALGKAGSAAEAVVELETMIDEFGETSERCGILGGRYKGLWHEAEAESPKAEDYLSKAIGAYETGMYADLNAYHCASNLPRLYRSLRSDDAELQAKAERATGITLAACERAVSLDRGDEWLKPTLLATAFEEGKLEQVRQLVREVQVGDRASWQLKSLISDLRISLAHHGAELQEQLRVELGKLEVLIVD